MKAKLVSAGGRRPLEDDSNPEDQIKGYEMLVGNSMDCKEARNRFIDGVENLLEFESLERRQQHSMKNFDNATVHNEMFEVQIR